jgi:RecB family exonuclease
MKNASVLEKNVPVFDFLKLNLAEKIIFIGKLDFLGELPNGNLHVLDFKTGTKEEDDSTQLYSYAILAEANLQKTVSKISYWYLDRESVPKEAVLDPLEDQLKWLKEKSIQI